MSSLRKALFSLLTVPLTASVVALGNQSATAMPSQAIPTQEATRVAGDPTSMTSGFYVDPNSNPATWVRQNAGHADAALIRTQIAEKAGGRWFGNWSGDIAAATRSFTTAADNADKLPILVAYNIPGRDCGSHSGGGAGSPEAYRTWISRFADGIGNRPAVVIIEPDALAQLDCVPAAEKQTRLDLLKYAVNQFASKNPNTWAYMDGGNATWIEAGEMARRLKLVEVGKIRGFALNTSNYYTTAQSVTKGNAIRGAVGGGAVRDRHQPQRQRLERRVVQPGRPEARRHLPQRQPRLGHRRHAAVAQGAWRLRRQLWHRRRHPGRHLLPGPGQTPDHR